MTNGAATCHAGPVANSRSGDSIITRVTRILESFDSTRVTQTPSGVSRRTGLPVSSAHRLMNELADNGFLERDDQGGFRIGMRLWELTTRGSNALGLRQVAMPFMEEVQAGIREHTQLGVLEQDEVLFIERLSARQAGANITKIAGRLPLNASSSGLVLLAYAPPAYQERFLSSPLKRLSPETIGVTPLLRATSKACPRVLPCLCRMVPASSPRSQWSCRAATNESRKRSRVSSVQRRKLDRQHPPSDSLPIE